MIQAFLWESSKAAVNGLQMLPPASHTHEMLVALKDNLSVEAEPTAIAQHWLSARLSGLRGVGKSEELSAGWTAAREEL